MQLCIESVRYIYLFPNIPRLVRVSMFSNEKNHYGYKSYNLKFTGIAS